LISDFAFNSIIDYERKGYYGYATMKVDACISMGFLATKVYGKTKSSSTFSK
jgi:hypothetical protein